jgi:hypothetical protein
MVPEYIRHSVDSIRIDIPESFISNAAVTQARTGMDAAMMMTGGDVEEDEAAKVKPIKENQ